MTIDKVNLDKQILFREKQKILWQNTTAKKTAQSFMDGSLRKQKEDRYQYNQKQKEAYKKMLAFLETRETKPM